MKRNNSMRPMTISFGNSMPISKPDIATQGLSSTATKQVRDLMYCGVELDDAAGSPMPATVPFFPLETTVKFIRLRDEERHVMLDVDQPVG
jgi:hypothetical protein